MIDQYCPTERSNVLDCLKPRIDSTYFDSRCRKLVVNRMQTEKLDVRLLPGLQNACKQDMEKFCRDKLVAKATEREGKVIKCLKKQFSVPGRLSDNCAIEVKKVIEEAQKDFGQDPVLHHACSTE